ncbi:hypothetical protein [Burkholderia cenocepacia]|uniref:hypothetical protein n=1 Tax=Burkholderia cenocepacia TaxID=95486 RepID=UPI0021AB7C9C|nr:hypothetical protein [Burkholderia cenocepacia]
MDRLERDIGVEPAVGELRFDLILRVFLNVDRDAGMRAQKRSITLPQRDTP